MHHCTLRSNLTPCLWCRNEFETFLFQTRNQLDNELQGKLGDDEDTVRNAVRDGFDWLDENPDAEISAYKEKQNEVYDVVKPIMAQHSAESGEAGGGDDDSHDEL